MSSRESTNRSGERLFSGIAFIEMAFAEFCGEAIQPSSLRAWLKSQSRTGILPVSPVETNGRQPRKLSRRSSFARNPLGNGLFLRAFGEMFLAFVFLPIEDNVRIKGVHSMTNETAMEPADFWTNRPVLQKEQEIYDAVRKKLQSLHPDINKRSNRAEMEDVARKLDILRQGIFCFDSEEHTAVFSDYLMHFSRLRDTTPCERYLKSVDRRDADEITQRAYDALAGVRYTVLRMDESIAGFGVLCRDCFLGIRIFLMDRSLSQTTAGQIALATGVFPVKEWFMTTGAGLPLPAKKLDETLGELFKLAGLKFTPPVALSPADNSRLVLKVIKTINAAGIIENVRYQ